jgi:hypothetical protein
MAPVHIERGMGHLVCPIAHRVLRLQANLLTLAAMRTIALLLGATALLALPASASAFTCSRHSADVKVTGGTLNDLSVAQPVTNGKIDDKGFYELSEGATAVVTIDRATATITAFHGSKAAFQLSCYQYHSDRVQPLLKTFAGSYRVRAPASDAKKIGVSTPEGLANMITARRTDFTVSRVAGNAHKRTTIKVAKGAGTVLVGAFKNLAKHSPCTPGRKLVIEPSGRIHSG